MSADKGLAAKVLAGLPETMRDAMGPEEQQALNRAIDDANQAQWAAPAHGVDARYNFPWFGGRAYLRVLAGREKRPSKRTKSENQGGVGRRVANFVAILFLACGFYTFAGLGLLMASAVLE